GAVGNNLKVGQGGIVVPSDNVEGFVQALSILLDDPQLLREMGQKALEITVPHFTWEGMTRRLLEAMKVEYGG
ncbi:MAG: glycosyltransferase, partial [Guyparkeria sp.]